MTAETQKQNNDTETGSLVGGVNSLVSCIKELVDALEEITYENSTGCICIGCHGDSDCTETVKPALDEARKILSS